MCKHAHYPNNQSELCTISIWHALLNNKHRSHPIAPFILVFCVVYVAAICKNIIMMQRNVMILTNGTLPHIYGRDATTEYTNVCETIFFTRIADKSWPIPVFNGCSLVYKFAKTIYICLYICVHVCVCAISSIYAYTYHSMHLTDIPRSTVALN